MCNKTTIDHLYAGKPQAFGPRQSPSSIIKMPFESLNVTYNGAIEDEQGNKKLHGGPYMALHQYAQESYANIANAFPHIAEKLTLGSIGENMSSPNMNEDTVFIGDEYRIGTTIIRVVSPRAPCSKINHRYGIKKVDLHVANCAITGWYYSVIQEGKISIGDEIVLSHRQPAPLSVKQIWQLRLQRLPNDNPQALIALAIRAYEDPSLAPDWQADMHRVSVKLAKNI